MHIAYLHYQTADDTALHHVRQFAAAARQIGHRVDVYAMNLAAGDGAGGAPGAARLRRFAKRHAARYLHEPKELLWNARYVPRELRLLRANRPDVLLVRDHLLTASCIPVARRLRLPLVLEVNAPADESRYYLDQYWHLPWLPERLERWKLSRADGITTVSTPLKAHLVRRYGLDAERLTVVPNGADVDAFRVAGAAAPRAAAGAAPVVGFVGSFQQWHGTALLRRVVDMLAGPRLHFLLVGADAADGALRRSLVDAPRERYVRLTGRVPHGEVPRYVAAMDVALIADAGFYQSPLKLLEYMAAGRAIVAPRHAAIEEVAGHRRHALLFEPGDAADAAACVRQLLADAELRRDLGTAARARVAGELTWRHNAARVAAACGRAMALHGSPEPTYVRNRSTVA